MSLLNELNKKNISMKTLSEKSGVAYPIIHNLCSGKSKPENVAYETIFRISKVLNINSEELFSNITCKSSILKISLASPNEDKRLLFGNFLDDFYRANKEEKEKMITDEPIGDKEDAFLCEMAAAAEVLAKRNGIKIPKWCNKKKYFMKVPYYPIKTNRQQVKDFLRETSLPEYAKRNIYYGNNVLKRC